MGNSSAWLFVINNNRWQYFQIKLNWVLSVGVPLPWCHFLKTWLDRAGIQHTFWCQKWDFANCATITTEVFKFFRAIAVIVAPLSLNLDSTLYFRFEYRRVKVRQPSLLWKFNSRTSWRYHLEENVDQLLWNPGLSETINSIPSGLQCVGELRWSTSQLWKTNRS